ncbi:class I SAM-dependent methyltransferase [Methanolacinia petrolearia]|uniref:class I SAM-dependent methyltransferase n=1 Tax=Methanolacinia petrolearia TaxID=54120 RepID=UPI003BAA3192
MDSVNNRFHNCRTGERDHHRGRGPTSFWMQDPKLIFTELDLKHGDVFLDLGCGTGDYSICAAEEVGESGIVYAADINRNLIDDLLENSGQLGLNNIKGVISDIHETLPFEDSSIDVCLISTVLHSVDLENCGKALFTEIARILKPQGRLFVIECKKEETGFGPPLQMRLSPEAIKSYASSCGLNWISMTDLGYNYMIRFSPEEGP